MSAEHPIIQTIMRRRVGLVEDLMEIAAHLPWFVSVVLAGVLYCACHLFASGAVAPAARPGDLRIFAADQFGRTIAAILQYVLPLVFLAGASASLLRRRRRNTLLNDVAAGAAGSLHTLSWQDFERLVGASYERQGYQVANTGGGGADGGVDLLLTKGQETTLVQCKHWRAQKVGVTTVRELYGVMAARGAARGIVVSAGDFTPDALEFVKGRNIALVGGRALSEMLRSATVIGTSTPVPSAPSCPRCGARMVRRVARQGRSAGEAFWGCETFPRCRATAPVV